MKKFWTGILTAALSLTLAMPAYAGWMQSSNHADDQSGASNWWYQYDDGSYASNGWYWLDGDGDGFAESYYFDANGWLYTGTIVDGFSVNESGMWTQNGNVQYQFADKVAAGSAKKTGETAVTATEAAGDKTNSQTGTVSNQPAIRTENSQSDSASDNGKTTADTNAGQSARDTSAGRSNTGTDVNRTQSHYYQNQSASQDTSAEVHVTKTGQKYHRSGCKYLKKSDSVITLSVALSRGLEPCSVCY